MKKHILIVDNNILNLKLLENFLEGLYKITLMNSGIEAIKFLINNKVDLILVDINMPNMNGYETVKKIKGNVNLKDIPVIFLTSKVNYEIEAKIIELGAVDFIRKPFVKQMLINKIKIYLEVESCRKNLDEKINRLQDVIIISLAELVECRDENTGGHVKRTAKYVKILTEALLEEKVYENILTKEYAYDLIKSAPLHDIGKIGISDATLLKNGSLDDEEFEFMKQHTTLGALALQKMIDESNGESFLYLAKDMAKYHHEKWDGTGYPDRLKGEEIPLCARIMAIGDVYDALTTKRPYKKAFSHDESIKIILKGKGSSFDPKIIKVFEKISYKFKIEKEAL
ncbi:HD domain-containing phosphohydrolase [uncultured Clostridium sp.]|uniref:HD domain-containing phosphohydrolase n=1 Tax=uncultured Clostridium sp. TaxID=59620 RepID=UPI00258C3B06|nr:HD domain-containing phosphohydrolase [uncultured Clostridium sp.]